MRLAPGTWDTSQIWWRHYASDHLDSVEWKRAMAVSKKGGYVWCWRSSSHWHETRLWMRCEQHPHSENETEKSLSQCWHCQEGQSHELWWKLIVLNRYLCFRGFCEQMGLVRSVPPLNQPDSKVHGANMRPTSVLSAPDGWTPCWHHESCYQGRQCLGHSAGQCILIVAERFTQDQSLSYKTTLKT